MEWVDKQHLLKKKQIYDQHKLSADILTTMKKSAPSIPKRKKINHTGEIGDMPAPNEY